MARLETILGTGSEDNAKVYEELGQLVVSEKGMSLLEQVKAARAEYNQARGQVLLISRQATNDAAAYDLARTQMDPASQKYVSALASLTDFIQTESDEASTNIQASVQSSQNGISIGLALATLVGMVVAFLIVSKTSRTLRDVSSSLNDGFSQVASAANQVSAASQTLAQGFGEQASSLEETSSSLEEMSSMTKRNAKNARKANVIAKQAREAADKGASDMHTMSAAMQDIKVSSDDIAKIIKTIDEIAFQTNILALNAAVEAARAGEAGMGFAVVADEVRNLAQRCAQAAKETAGKIEGAIIKTGQGVEISNKVVLALNDITAKVREVDDLVAEVASASQEQTNGIAQINAAVGQMDKVTQNNAATAEESAAAAEELNAQSEVMKRSVTELVHLVGGAGVAPVRTANEAKPRWAAKPMPMVKSKPVNGNRHHSTARKPEMATRRGEIPLDGDFKDF